MDKELRRLEEKQKLTNLQIDKRLALIENALEDLKTEFEAITIPDSSPKIKKLSDEIERLKTERKKELEQIAAMAQNLDITKLSKDFSELKEGFEDLKEHFNREVKRIETLQNALLGLEERGKLPQCDSSFANLDYDTRLVKEKIADFQKRLEALEKSFIASRISQPVIME